MGKSWHRARGPSIIWSSRFNPELRNRNSFTKEGGAAVSSTVFVSTLAMLLAMVSIGMWWVAVRNRSRFCPRCESPTVLLAPPGLLRRLGPRLSRRWCTECGWRGFVLRRIFPTPLPGRGTRPWGAPRWSSVPPSRLRPVFKAPMKPRPAETRSSSDPKQGEDPVLEPGRESLPDPFRWGPLQREDRRPELTWRPRDSAPLSFPALHSEEGSAPEPNGPGEKTTRKRPARIPAFFRRTVRRLRTLSRFPFSRNR
jgi:hypothetical protein